MKNNENLFSSVRVLCVGDLMLDRFVYGSVDRISPEAPVPVFHISREFNSLGGAANVANNLVNLGAQVTLMGRIGDDAAGICLSDLLKNLPFISPILLKEGKTTYKTRFSAQSQQLLRVDDELVSEPSLSAVSHLKQAISKAIENTQVIILSDYGKGILTEEFCQFIIAKAQEAQLTVIVDPKGTDYRKYRGATLLSPNVKELHQVTRMAVDSDEAIINAGIHLMQTLSLKGVLVTRSEKGMTLLSQSADPLHIPTQARDVFDVSGAGDTVIATLAAGIGSGFSWEKSVRLANMAAGIVVAKSGTASITLDELSQVLEHQIISQHHSKIRTVSSQVEIVHHWRRQGLKVGFTNGCFDLLHAGHIHVLTEARKQCDRLIVGLNSDASVQRLKGPTRPIQDESVRALVLSSLAAVDGVVVFEEETPLSLIESFLPDVLIKGADYTVNQVVGHEVVQKHGGRVHLVDLQPGQSTTLTVDKLSAKG